VKREPRGVASAYLHERVGVGDTIEVAAPRGTFIMRDGDTPVLLLSAGVGVTPVLAMLHALAAEHAGRQLWWLHGARNGTEHAFAHEARSLLADLPNARAHICYSQPGPDDRLGDSYTDTGRLTAELIGRLGVPRDADAYVCGPTAFMDQLTPALVDLGFGRPRVHTETFGATGSLAPGITTTPTGPPHPPAGPPGTGPAVSFARSDLTIDWDPGYASLLELAEACDVPTRWSCRTGVCHTCETALVSGSVAYSPEPIDTPADGNVLICSARPESEVVLDL
jgi:ferredoxin-NADP reductase